MTQWKDNEIEILKNHYANKGAPYCAKELGRTETAIRKKAVRLGIKSNINQRKTHENYENDLMELDLPFVPIEKYINTRTPILHECFNGHVFLKSPNHITTGGACPECSLTKKKLTETYQLELDSLCTGYKVIGEYKNNKESILHMCEQGHSWNGIPSNILRGGRCPSCSTSGFDINKPAILYYIKISKDNLKYYKVGITNRTIALRFNRENTCSITVLKETLYDLGSDALAEEQKILREYAKFRQNIPELLVSGGNTELFEFDILELDK